MFTKTAAAVSLASLAGLASAKVGGMTAPTSLTGGQNFTVTLSYESYIQPWQDLGVLFGIKTAPANGSTDDPTFDEYVGTTLEYFNLAGVDPSAPGGPNANYTFSIGTDPNISSGDYYLVAAVPFNGNNGRAVGIQYFNQSVTVQGIPSAPTN